MVGADGVGLNYHSGFKAFHRLTDTALGCWSICSGGVPTAVRPNHICFQVIFTGTFTTSWDSLFSKFPLFLGFCA